MINFMLGVLASLCATIIYEFYRYFKSIGGIRSSFGWWLEIVPNSVGCRYSIARLYYNKRASMVAFDGTNYNDDGTPRCHWETISGVFDFSAKKYFYTFQATLEAERNINYYGFGVLDFEKKDETNTLIPSGGHYISANIDDSPMSHSMVSMKQFPAYAVGSFELRKNISQLITLVKQQGVDPVNLIGSPGRPDAPHAAARNSLVSSSSAR